MHTSSGSAVGRAADGCRPGQQGLVLIAITAVGCHLDDLLDVGESAADLLDVRLQVRTDDQHLGA